MSRARPLLLIAAALAITVSAFILAVPSLQRSFFYPKPSGIPPVVSSTTDQLLARLQVVLETKAPLAAASLQPGLSSSQITALETEGGFRLSDDLRSLYRWHDGIAAPNAVELLPGHRFVPLAEAVRERTLIAQQLAATSMIERATFSVFAGHRRDWIPVMPDGAGDGYFYDPTRTEHEGAFFYHFAEDRTYRWFPSLRNFLAGVIECYESGAIKPAADRKTLEEDYARTEQIWRRLAQSRE